MTRRPRPPLFYPGPNEAPGQGTQLDAVNLDVAGSPSGDRAPATCSSRLSKGAERSASAPARARTSSVLCEGVETALVSLAGHLPGKFKLSMFLARASPRARPRKGRGHHRPRWRRARKQAPARHPRRHRPRPARADGDDRHPARGSGTSTTLLREAEAIRNRIAADRTCPDRRVGRKRLYIGSDVEMAKACARIRPNAMAASFMPRASSGATAAPGEAIPAHELRLPVHI